MTAPIWSKEMRAKRWHWWTLRKKDPSKIEGCLLTTLTEALFGAKNKSYTIAADAGKTGWLRQKVVFGIKQDLFLLLLLRHSCQVNSLSACESLKVISVRCHRHLSTMINTSLMSNLIAILVHTSSTRYLSHKSSREEGLNV